MYNPQRIGAVARCRRTCLNVPKNCYISTFSPQGRHTSRIDIAWVTSAVSLTSSSPVSLSLF